MKNSISTMLDSYVFDNSEFIKKNGGNAAEYILKVAQEEDHGWFWFLTEKEIEEFENDNEKAKQHIEEITTYVNENYDYTVE